MNVMTNFDDVGERLVEHDRNNTTDSAERVMAKPVSYYLDEELWHREMDLIFKRLPLLLAMSSELREAGQYKAMNVIDTPVIVMRGKDGQARAFMNVCQHRGAKLVQEGAGTCNRRLVCPYHAWAYNDKGELVTVAEEHKFGEIDKSTKGLKELPCQEVAGLIFVILTPGLPIDLEDYLAGFLDEIRPLGIEDWEVYRTHGLDSANWKITHDGYVDGYHIGPLHPNTVGVFSKTNVLTFDAYGPHQKIGFANKNILELPNKTPEERAIDPCYSLVRTMFPNVSFAVGPNGGMISQMFPGPTPDKSWTIQNHMVKKQPETDEEKAMADGMVEMLIMAVRDEDYFTVKGIQKGIESGAIDEILMGKSELGNQRLHQWIEYYTQEQPNPADRPNP